MTIYLKPLQLQILWKLINNFVINSSILGLENYWSKVPKIFIKVIWSHQILETKDIILKKHKQIYNANALSYEEKKVTLNFDGTCDHSRRK